MNESSQKRFGFSSLFENCFTEKVVLQYILKQYTSLKTDFGPLAIKSFELAGKY